MHRVYPQIIYYVLLPVSKWLFVHSPLCNEKITCQYNSVAQRMDDRAINVSPRHETEFAVA